MNERARTPALSPCLDTPSNQREEQRHHLGADDRDTSIDDDLGEHYHQDVSVSENDTNIEENTPSAS